MITRSMLVGHWLALLLGCLSIAQAQTWNVDADGSWINSANWSPATAPNAVGATATLGNVITAARTVNIGSGLNTITLGTLNFDSTFAYSVISANDTLVFDAASGNAAINATGASHALGSNNTNFQLTDTVVVNVDSSTSRVLTWNGVIAGASGIIKDGAGTVRLGGTSANTFTGPVQINDGLLDLRKASAIAGGNTVTVGDGTGAALSAQLLVTTSTGGAANAFSVVLASDGLMNSSGASWRIRDLSGTGTVSLSGNNFRELVGGVGDTVYAGTITGGTTGGTFTSGNRFIKNGTDTQTLSGNNTYLANTFINGGVLRAASNNALGATGAGAATTVQGTGQLQLAGSVTIGETLNLTGTGGAGGTGDNTLTGPVSLNGATTISAASSSALTFAASSTLDLNSQSLTLATDGNITVDTVIADAVNILKTGPGELTFGAAQNITGTFTLAGGTLDLGGFAHTVNTLAITGDTFLDFTGTSTLNVETITIAAGATLTVRDWVNGVDFFYSNTDPGAATLPRIVFNGFTGADTRWLPDEQISPVPEPRAFGLLAISALVGLVATRRRPRHREQARAACAI
jgi:fibronectin-binding autotransporter adhesin